MREFEEPRWDESTLGSGSRRWLGRRTFGDETRDTARPGSAAGWNDFEGRNGVKATTFRRRRSEAPCRRYVALGDDGRH